MQLKNRKALGESEIYQVDQKHLTSCRKSIPESEKFGALEINKGSKESPTFVYNSCLVPA